MTLSELFYSELKAGVLNSDEDALKRFSLLISEKISKVDYIEEQQENSKSDLRALIETVKVGFEQVNKRFEQVDKRFEQVDKRFEQMDKRFEDLQRSMDKRFDMMFKFMSPGFSIITILIVVFKFMH